MMLVWSLGWEDSSSWRRAWQPTLVFLAGESHGQRNLVGYSSRDCKDDSDPPISMIEIISLFPFKNFHGWAESLDLVLRREVVHWVHHLPRLLAFWLEVTFLSYQDLSCLMSIDFWALNSWTWFGNPITALQRKTGHSFPHYVLLKPLCQNSLSSSCFWHDEQALQSDW